MLVSSKSCLLLETIDGKDAVAEPTWKYLRRVANRKRCTAIVKVAFCLRPSTARMPSLSLHGGIHGASQAEGNFYGINRRVKAVFCLRPSTAWKPSLSLHGGIHGASQAEGNFHGTNYIVRQKLIEIKNN